MYSKSKQSLPSGMVGPFGRQVPLCFDRVQVALMAMFPPPDLTRLQETRGKLAN